MQKCIYEIWKKLWAFLAFVLSQLFSLQSFFRTKYNSENFTRLCLNNRVTGSDLLKSPGNFSYTCARSSACSFTHKSLNSSRKMYKYIHIDNSFMPVFYNTRCVIFVLKKELRLPVSLDILNPFQRCIFLVLFHFLNDKTFKRVQPIKKCSLQIR